MHSDQQFISSCLKFRKLFLFLLTAGFLWLPQVSFGAENNPQDLQSSFAIDASKVEQDSRLTEIGGPSIFPILVGDEQGPARSFELILNAKNESIMTENPTKAVLPYFQGEIELPELAIEFVTELPMLVGESDESMDYSVEPYVLSLDEATGEITVTSDFEEQNVAMDAIEFTPREELIKPEYQYVPVVLSDILYMAGTGRNVNRFSRADFLGREVVIGKLEKSIPFLTSTYDTRGESFSVEVPLTIAGSGGASIDDATDMVDITEALSIGSGLVFVVGDFDIEY